MAQGTINVGALDARARLVAGTLALLGGLAALDGFFQALGFLTWIVCAAMMYVGILLAMGGFKDGTAPFGYPLLILSVLDAWLPLVKGLLGTNRRRLCRRRRVPDCPDAGVSRQRSPGSEHRTAGIIGVRGGSARLSMA